MMTEKQAPRESATYKRFGGETRITHSMEDYLKAIYRLEQEGGPVSTQRLAEEIGFSGPSVTNMVKRLDELKLLNHNRYHGVSLTGAGERVALEVIRHHRLVELYLAEALGYDWDEVHQEAELLEHHVSEQMEARMERVLGYPRFDPHGDPIPSRSGSLPSLADVALTELATGSSGRVTRVSDRDPDCLRYLAGLGVKPGTELAVVNRTPVDGRLRIAIDDEEHMIPFDVARGVRLTPAI